MFDINANRVCDWCFRVEVSTCLIFLCLVSFGGCLGVVMHVEWCKKHKKVMLPHLARCKLIMLMHEYRAADQGDLAMPFSENSQGVLAAVLDDTPGR